MLCQLKFGAMITNPIRAAESSLVSTIGFIGKKNRCKGDFDL